LNQELHIALSDILEIIDLNWNLKNVGFSTNEIKNAFGNPNRKLNVTILVLLSPQKRTKQSSLRKFNQSRDIFGLVQDMLYKEEEEEEDDDEEEEDNDEEEEEEEVEEEEGQEEEEEDDDKDI
jgi:Ran GTPase-activating protein (RanGAP) involved in mRNA processing and transport